MNAQRLKEPSLTGKMVITETTVSSKCIRCGSSKQLADRCPFRQANLDHNRTNLWCSNSKHTSVVNCRIFFC